MIRCSFSQVHEVLPDDGGGYSALNGMSFSDSSHGWFASEFVAYRTIDAGRNWEQRWMEGRARNLGRLSAPTPDMCAVLVKFTDGIEYCLTNDGGKTWRTRRIESAGNRSALDIHFLDERNGWILAGPELHGHSSQVLVTEDGGIHWECHELFLGKPANIWFSNPSDGWLIVKGEATREPTFTVVMESATGEITIPFGGERNWVCRSLDGGRTWIPLSWLDHDLTGIVAHCLRTTRAYVSGLEGYLAASDDGGTTWSTIVTGFPGDLYRPACKNETVVVPGVGGIIVSLDGALTWHKFELDDAPFKVDLFDDYSGIIGATRGVYTFQITR